MGEVFAYTTDSTEYAWSPGQYYYTYNISEYDQMGPSFAGEHQRNEPHFRKPLVHHGELLGAKSAYTTRITGASLISSYVPVDNGFNPQSDGFAILSMGIRNLSTRNGWLWDYGMVGVLGGDFGFRRAVGFGDAGLLTIRATHTDFPAFPKSKGISPYIWPSIFLQ